MSKRSSASKLSPQIQDRFNTSEVVKYYEKNGILKKTRPPSIPKAANWGWNHLPTPAKIMILGVFSGAVSVTTPYWACIKSDSLGYATYGLWHFCNGDQCSSIHDNLVPGKSVETWYHLVQGCMCIGVALSIVGLGMLTNSIEGKCLKMSITVHWTCACVLGISAVEHFLALYVFISYLQDTSFLFEENYTQHIDLYGSCYMGIISFACSLVSAFIVFIDESIYKKPSKKVQKSEGSLMDLLTKEELEYLSRGRFEEDLYDYYNSAYVGYMDECASTQQPSHSVVHQD